MTRRFDHKPWDELLRHHLRWAAALGFRRSRLVLSRSGFAASRARRPHAVEQSWLTLQTRAVWSCQAWSLTPRQPLSALVHTGGSSLQKPLQTRALSPVQVPDCRAGLSFSLRAIVRTAQLLFSSACAGMSRPSGLRRSGLLVRVLLLTPLCIRVRRLLREAGKETSPLPLSFSARTASPTLRSRRTGGLPRQSSRRSLQSGSSSSSFRMDAAGLGAELAGSGARSAFQLDTGGDAASVVSSLSQSTTTGRAASSGVGLVGGSASFLVGQMAVGSLEHGITEAVSTLEVQDHGIDADGSS